MPSTNKKTPRSSISHVLIPGQGGNKKKKKITDRRNDDQLANYKTSNRFGDDQVKDNVYIVKQRLSIAQDGIMSLCPSTMQLAFDCLKIGIHFGKSQRGLSERHSTLGTGLIAVNPYMETVFVQSGVAICIEAIVKGIAELCHLLVNQQSCSTLVAESVSTEVSGHCFVLSMPFYVLLTILIFVLPTQWILNCTPVLNVVVNELKNCESSRSFCNVSYELMKPFTRTSAAEGTELSSTEQQQLTNMIPHERLEGLAHLADEWLRRKSTLYAQVTPPPTTSQDIQQAEKLFGGGLHALVRPVLRERSESFNQATSKVILYTVGDDTSSIISLVNAQSSSTHVLYLCERMHEPSATHHQRAIACNVEFGIAGLRNMLSRFGKYQVANPSRVSFFAVLLRDKDTAKVFEDLIKASFSLQRRKGEENSFLTSQVSDLVAFAIDVARGREVSFLGSPTGVLSRDTFTQFVPSETVQRQALADVNAGIRSCIPLDAVTSRTLAIMPVQPMQEKAGSLERDEYANFLQGLIVYARSNDINAFISLIHQDRQLVFNHTRSQHKLLAEARTILRRVRRGNSNVWDLMCQSSNPARYLFDELGFSHIPLPQSINDSLAMKWELHISNEFQLDCIQDRHVALDRITTLK